MVTHLQILQKMDAHLTVPRVLRKPIPSRFEAQHCSYKSYLAHRLTPMQERSPSKNARSINQEQPLLPELAVDPWDQHPKPPPAQPFQRQTEPPGIAHATYQPYNPKPAFMPPPIKKLSIQTPAPQAARPYLPPATPAAKPPPASLRPTAAVFNPMAPAYKPPIAAYHPPTAAYNPPAAAYNPPAAGYNPTGTAYMPQQDYRQGSIGLGEVPYAGPPNPSHWDAPQQQYPGQSVQSTGSYNRPDADLQMMMNHQARHCTCRPQLLSA